MDGEFAQASLVLPISPLYVDAERRNARANKKTGKATGHQKRKTCSNAPTLSGEFDSTPSHRMMTVVTLFTDTTR